MFQKKLLILLLVFSEQIFSMSRCYRVNCLPLSSTQKGSLRAGLYGMVDKAKFSILASIFTFRDKELARKLVLAQARGVDVQVIMDASSGEESCGIKQLLEKFDVPVMVYKESNSINHNKYLIVDDKKIWIGSMNFTNQAYERNRESAVVIFSRQVANFYTQDFEDTERTIKEQILKEKQKKLNFEKQLAQEKAKYLEDFALWQSNKLQRKSKNLRKR